MVDSMVVAPVREGLKDEQPGEPANPQVRSPARQEGAVGTIMEDENVRTGSPPPE